MFLVQKGILRGVSVWNVRETGGQESHCPGHENVTFLMLLFNVKEVCALASTMSDTVICSGPLPAYRGDEIHSRLSSLNGWMSKWCPQNNIGFIDNWTSFWGRPDLLKRDGVHPSWGGAAILSRNLAHSLRVHT